MAFRMHMYISMKTLTLSNLKHIVSKTTNEQLKQQAQAELVRRAILGVK